MANIVTCCSPTAVDDHQELVTNCARTRTAPCCSASVASSTWPVALSIALLHDARLDATMWHSRCLENLSKNTLLRLMAVHRTCPGNGKVSAGTPQGNQGSSNFSLQPPLAFTPAADSPPHAGSRRKRPGDEDGDDDRGKRPRIRKKAPGGSPQKVVVCPFKLKYRGNPKFENCGAYGWTRLIQHLRDRKHRPRDRCQRCGSDFFEDVLRDAHTSTCNKVPSREFERPICVERDMVPEIAGLTQQGRRNPPIEELYVRLWAILFPNNLPAPDSNLWLRITHGQTTDDLGGNHRLQDDQKTLEETHPTVDNVPNDGSLQLLQEYNESSSHIINEQTGMDRSHEPTSEEACLVEQFQNHGLQTQDPTPPAPPGEEQMPQNSEDQLEDSPSNFPSWGPGSQSPQDSLHAIQPLPDFQPVSQQLDPGYVNPQQLDAQHFQPHELNNSSSSEPTYPTFTMSDWSTSNSPYTLHNGMMQGVLHDPVLSGESEWEIGGSLGDNSRGS